RYVRAHCVGRELIVDEGVEADALPTALAQQAMGGCHGLDASVERLKELVNRAAALARGRSDHCNLREDVLDPMVDLRDQQCLALFGPLALGDVAHDAGVYLPPGHVHFTDCKLDWNSRAVLALSRQLTSTRSAHVGLASFQIVYAVPVVLWATQLW